jgi:uncharacterized protein YegJ (DUF2314 family)
MMRRPALLLAACLAFAQAAQAQDPIIQFSATDALMDNAIFEARQSLPLFLAHVLSPEGKPLREDILLKVGLPTVPGSDVEGEHIWVGTINRLPDGSFTGSLVNEPNHLGNLKKGDQISFTSEMISDWFLLAPTGRYYGSYTLRVMHGQGAFGQTPFDQVFETDPVPLEWR